MISSKLPCWQHVHQSRISSTTGSASIRAAWSFLYYATIPGPAAAVTVFSVSVVVVFVRLWTTTPGCFRDHLLKLLYCAGLASTRHLCSDTDRAFGGTGLRMPAPKQARHGSTFLQKLRLVNLAAELAGVVACDARFSEVVVVVCCFASRVGGVLCIPIFAREGSSPENSGDTEV